MYIEVAAHQGNIALCPSNTIAAYSSAYDIGADMIECDIHMTRDGELVMIHDATLDRTTDLQGAVKDLTLDEIKRADAGIKRGREWSGTRIPTLTELCELAVRGDGAMQFNFEFKVGYSFGVEWSRKCADKIIETVDRYGLWERSFVNSFDGALLRYIEDKYDSRFRLHGFYPYGILGKERPKKLYCACLWKSKINGVAAFEGTVNPKEDFDALLSDGVRPWVGASVKTLEDMKRAAELGAELITSNEPEYMIRELTLAGLRRKEI